VDDESPSYDTIVATQRDQFVDDIHIRRLLIFGDNIAKIADMTLIILRSSVLFLQTKNYHQRAPIIPRTFVGLKCPPAATQPSPRSPFSWMWKPCFPAGSPLMVPSTLTPSSVLVKVTLPSMVSVLRTTTACCTLKGRVLGRFEKIKYRTYCAVDARQGGRVNDELEHGSWKEIGMSGELVVDTMCAKYTGRKCTDEWLSRC
jgi:hypothetical protein